MSQTDGAERHRLDEDERRAKNWRRWGPYLPARQWGTVREDYSSDGSCWTYFTHDQARSRAYRWGEDGLLGLTDRECRLCFALALWNGKDPILKERFFGLGNGEGNHGEDVKELYFYLDGTPTYSYLRALYKYPQAEFPYLQLVEENRRRGRTDAEFEIEDTGVFDGNRYFDVQVEYAKANPEDILIRVCCANRGDHAADLDVLPTLWLRNTWAWGRAGEGYWPKGRVVLDGPNTLAVDHPSLGRYVLACEGSDGTTPPRFLFTENETNTHRLFGAPNVQPYVKDAFHRFVIDGEEGAVNPANVGTKAACWYHRTIPAAGEVVIRVRLSAESAAIQDPFDGFDALFSRRQDEADEYFAVQRGAPLPADRRIIVRQADAGLIWSRQFYQYSVEHWLEGDPLEPAPPPARRDGPNGTWTHFSARDVLSVPDTWEYPWFAAWDLSFHCVAMARIDPVFAKHQLELLCREWYMHPNGQLPAYEFAFSDVNPPVQAWAALRVYQLASQNGFGRDRQFLERVFQKLVVNFTWWVNREDLEGDNLFSGGFLGLDNICVFDRSKPLPGGGRLEQADATAWVAFFCTTMLAIAMELASENPAYADMAWKFFEHFVWIAEAINKLGGSGLWDQEDGFYYDLATAGGHSLPLRIRSMVGLIPLLAVESLDADALQRLPLFKTRLAWFVENRPALARDIAYLRPDPSHERRLLAIPTRERLVRVLAHMLDEREFLSPYGIRSLSKEHLERPSIVGLGGQQFDVCYAPGESDTALLGGNSNWRGPIWMPVNYLLIEALKRYHHFYRDTLTVECPTGSGRLMNLREVAEHLEQRLVRLFLPDASGQRPCFGSRLAYSRDPHFRDLVLFHEYFHAEDGRGLGASHQTGWTALVANVLERVAWSRTS